MRGFAVGRLISGLVGYGITASVLYHFLTHREPWTTNDLVLASFGVLGLQVGIGKSVTEGIEALGRLAEVVRTGHGYTAAHRVARRRTHRTTAGPRRP